MSFKIKLSAELEPETQETYNVVKCFSIYLKLII